MNMPTYNTSTPIHSAQFSRILRVIMYCAMRLTVVVAASKYGSAAPGRRDVIWPRIAHTATPIAPSAIHRRGEARDTRSGV
jgi:hypothetical protein